MSYILLSDIHSNYPALRAVVERESLDATYIVLGDLMGLLARPAAVIDLLEEIQPQILLAGNHDRAIFEFGEGHVNSAELSSFEHDHTMERLTSEQIERMRSVPFMDVLQVGTNRICATHAYPWPEQASGYEAGNVGVPKRDVTHIASVVSDDYDYVFHGHTHQKYDLDCSKFGHGVYFVNPGSLGYDGTYSVVDTEARTVDHRSVEYDHDAVKEHIADVLPDDAPSVDRWY